MQLTRAATTSAKASSLAVASVPNDAPALPCYVSIALFQPVGCSRRLVSQVPVRFSARSRGESPRWQIGVTPHRAPSSISPVEANWAGTLKLKSSGVAVWLQISSHYMANLLDCVRFSRDMVLEPSGDDSATACLSYRRVRSDHSRKAACAVSRVSFALRANLEGFVSNL